MGLRRTTKRKLRRMKTLRYKLTLDSALSFVCAGLLLLLPLTFSTAVHRTSTLPKFALLICGASVVLSLLMLAAATRSIDLSGTVSLWPFRLMALFLFVIGLSAVLGQAPVASLFGSYINQMGVLTHLSFLLVYLGLIATVTGHKSRLIRVLWAIALAGLLAGAYATAQFFGSDLFLSPSSYTFQSSGSPILRPPGTLGHPDVLGNFLLYTWPVGLALARLSTGSARRIAFVVVGFSIIALVLSGTRGAWLGAIAGSLSLLFLQLRSQPNWRPSVKTIGVSFALAVALFALVSLISPVRRAASSRARDVVAEGITGSGRTYLWRDALRMLPRYAIIGCGPEAFSKVFPQYRSEELARYSAGIANESSHNMYLDAAISFGIPGAALYLAIVLLALYRLFKRQAQESDPIRQVVIAGVAPAIVGAAVHNFFMYDQIATGLYFYAFMALALIVTTSIKPTPQVPRTDKVKSSDRSTRELLLWPAAAVSLMAVAASVWYAVSLLGCDRAVKNAYVAAGSGDIEALDDNCREAAKSPDPTRAYSFAAAQAILADVTKRSNVLYPVAGDNGSSGERTRAITLGRSLAEESLSRSLTPADNCVLIGYFALCSGDAATCGRFANEAVRLDPFNLNARWLMAEALFAQGNHEDAVREAKDALEISPGFDRAQSILIRARTESERLKRASRALERGNPRKAERILKRVIRLSGDQCPACHRALALLYEQTVRPDDAIVEWKKYEVAVPDQARAEGVAARIASLETHRK